MHLQSSAVLTFAILLLQLSLYKALIEEKPVPGSSGHSCDGRQCVCHCHPDPHFNSFHSIYFDYHGGCDIVLVKSKLLSVHIRTKPYPWYASVSNVAVRIGRDIFELTDSSMFYFNKAVHLSIPTHVGGKPLLRTTTSYGQISYEIVLSNGAVPETIQMTVNPSWPQGGVSIAVNLHGSSYGYGVSGLCGTWDTPGMMSRDKTIDFALEPCSGTCYGEHWQFDSTKDGPFLFMDLPTTKQCTPPISGGGGEGGNKRQLLRKQLEEAPRILMTFEEVADKCASVIPDGAPERLWENCVYDVTKTGDSKYFELPAYVNPIELRFEKPRCTAYTDDCKRKGGTCTLGCDENKFYCIDSLCYDTSLQYTANDDKCFCAIPKYVVYDQTAPQKLAASP